MYVVVALHDYGKGKIARLVFMGANEVLAIQASRDVEKLGFPFHDMRSDVVVYRPEQGKVYRSDDYVMFSDHFIFPRTPVVMRRYKISYLAGDSWQEHWYDEKARKRDEEHKARELQEQQSIPAVRA